MHDTMTPVKTALVALIINIALSLTLMFPLKLGGLALATSISAFFNFIALYILLSRRLGDFGTKSIIDTIIKVALASTVMGIALQLFVIRVSHFSFLLLGAAIVIAIVLFLSAIYLFGVKEMKDLLSWISKRK